VDEARRAVERVWGEALGTGHRRGLILLGERSRTHEVAVGIVRRAHTSVWLGGDAPAEATRAVDLEGARGLLGREADAVVVDLAGGPAPDVLGAVHGVVRGGGVLVLRAPPEDRWVEAARDPRLAVPPHRAEDVSTRFLGRLLRVARGAPGVTVLDLEAGRAHGSPAGRGPPSGTEPDGPCRTGEQVAAVEALADLAATPERPVVLVADRGRGKSSALGLAAPRLLAAGLERVLVTAPRSEAAEQVLAHATADPAARERVRFVTAEAVAGLRRPGDALFVDEAAALPVPVLRRLLDTGLPVAFATTVHGYEGTGRGFLLRFLEELHRRHPGTTRIRLDEPIRWAPGDPLEAFVRDALLLDAQPAPAPEVGRADPSRVAHRVLDRERLARDDVLLREVFGLLVWAHYRTTPSDLHRMLDAPNLRLHALIAGDHVVAAALVAREGGLPEETVRAIEEGRHRPRGHALAETLVAHLGRPDGGTAVSERIVRIAVHPELRRRGLGRGLLSAIADGAAEEGVELLGALFAATPDLLALWRAAGFDPVRLSVSRGARSGEHSALVLRPLVDATRGLCDGLRRRLARDLPHQLSGSLRDLEPDLALAVLHASDPRAEPDLDDEDWRALVACAFGPRPHDVTARPAFALVRVALATGEPELDPEAARLSVARVLQRRPWSEVRDLLELPSVPSAMRRLRSALGPLVLSWGGPAAERLARRYG